MLVIIEKKEFEYQSDYPEGWKFSAGDPYKFPVQIGDKLCFIKRFEQKNPKNISGWELLLKLKGESEPNLSQIFDIKKTIEKGKDIYYIFYEFLDGVTLDKYVRTDEADLTLLSKGLFNAIRSLQKYDFWFADFCEKNVFCMNDGTFMLVDIDSTQKLTDMPDNEMYGSKDYWILVFKFYKEILNKADIGLSDINGISFNYLQIAFLILRLKLFYQGKRKDYNSTELYNLLSSRLNDTIPEIREIFLAVLQNGSQPISENEIKKLESLINEKIIKADKLNEKPMEIVNLPVIKQFATNQTEIEREGEFTLSWQVENATKLELYKNGALYRPIDINSTSINLVGFADGTQQQLSFHLMAYKDLTVAKSEPVIISLKNPTPVVVPINNHKKIKPVILLAGVVGILILSSLIFFIVKNRNKAPSLKVQYLRQYVDTAFTIYGSGFSSGDNMLVRLNDTIAKILAVYDDSLLVELPVKKIVPLNSDTVFVFLQMKNQPQHVGSFEVLPPPGIKQSDVYEDSTVTIYGKRLNTEAVKVFLDNMELPVTRRSEESITAKVQQLSDTVKGHTSTLTIKENSRTIFARKWIVAYDIVDLNKLSSQAKWIGGVLLNDGNSTGSTVDLAFPGSASDANGFALIHFATMEDNRNYFILQTHPTWAPNGTIKGFFPWQTLYGRKVFSSKVGFLINGRSTDGVTFQVWVHYRVNNLERWEQIKALKKVYTGFLETIYVELPKYIPNDFFIELRVDAGNQSNVDWAAWVRPAVISRKLRTPNLKDHWHLPIEILKYKDLQIMH